MSNENGGAGKGSEGDKGSQGGSEGSPDQVTVDALAAKLDVIDKKVSTGQGLTQQDEAILTELLAEDLGQAAPDAAKKAKAAKQEFGEQDFDKMSNKEMASQIMKFLGGEINSLKAQLTSQVSAVSQKTIDSDIKSEVKQCRAENPEDFDTYYDKTIKIAAQNPTLSVQQAYKLAKADDLMKAASQVKDDEAKRKKAEYSFPSKDSLGSEDLTESLKGKSVSETARLIAERIGLN